MPVIFAPIGTYLIREGVNSRVHYLALRGGDSTPLPITALSCWICEQRVDVLEEAEAGPRVEGNSNYGYEIQHIACANTEVSIEDVLALLAPVGWMIPPPGTSKSALVDAAFGVVEAEYADGCGPTCEGC